MHLRTGALLALLLAAALPARADAGADEAAFRRRSEDYVRAFLGRDVAFFQRTLADDAIAVLADGRQLAKPAFLVEAAKPVNAEDVRLREVSVRIFADAALVVAAVGYHRSDGTPVTTRFTTLYVRRDRDWLVEWVQWTRVTAP